jgi:hypothetical protein
VAPIQKRLLQFSNFIFLLSLYLLLHSFLFHNTFTRRTRGRSLGTLTSDTVSPPSPSSGVTSATRYTPFPYPSRCITHSLSLSLTAVSTLFLYKKGPPAIGHLDQSFPWFHVALHASQRNKNVFIYLFIYLFIYSLP